MVVTIRYWFFAAFVILLARARPGPSVPRPHPSAVPADFPRRPAGGEICIAVIAFVALGLVESHAIFTIYPLLVAALSGPILASGWAGGAGWPSARGSSAF